MVELMEDALAGVLAQPGRASPASADLKPLAHDLTTLASAIDVLTRRQAAI